MEVLNTRLKEIGIAKVAKACGVSVQAVYKWTRKGLPRTEWTGETSHAKTIATLSDKYDAKDFLVK